MTKHSIRRARARAGISREAAVKMFEKAFIYGKTAVDMPTRERRYMEERTDSLHYHSHALRMCRNKVPPDFIGRRKERAGGNKTA